MRKRIPKIKEGLEELREKLGKEEKDPQRKLRLHMLVLPEEWASREPSGGSRAVGGASEHGGAMVSVIRSRGTGGAAGAQAPRHEARTANVTGSGDGRLEATTAGSSRVSQLW